MYIKKFEKVGIIFTTESQCGAWAKKLNFRPKIRSKTKIHWSLLKSTGKRIVNIKIIC